MDIEALEARAQAAENHAQRGEFDRALEIYLDALARRLAATRQGRTNLRAADIVIVERLADLSVLLGAYGAADDLLAAMAGLASQAENQVAADYAAIKRVSLAVGSGDLHGALDALRGLQGSVGDVTSIVFTPDGLIDWEEACRWAGADAADRAMLFSQLHLSIGSLLCALGRYGEASAALERGLVHTGPHAPDLARQAAIPLQLTNASALLERGELRQAELRLRGLAGILDEVTDPGYCVRHKEVFAKLGLLTGDWGAALERLRQVVDLCRARGFRHGALHATINLAQVLIQVNQSRAATELLKDADAMARQSGDDASLARVALLLQLARARARSLADRVPIAPSVLEIWRHSERTPEVHAEADLLPPIDPPQVDDYLTFFEDRVLGYHWRLGRLDFDGAARFLEEIREVFQHSDSRLIHVRLQVMAGLLAYYQRDFHHAEAEISAALPILRELGLKPELWQAQRVLGWCWQELGRAVEDQNALAGDSNRLLADMTASLSTADRGVFLLNKWTADEEFIARQADELSAMQARLARAPWGRRLRQRWSLWQGINRLLTHIDRHKALVALRTLGGHPVEAAPQEPPSLFRRLTRQPRDRATITFLVLPDRVLVITCRRFFLGFGVTPLTRIEVRDLVGRWHELVSRGGPRGATTGRNIVSHSALAARETLAEEWAAVAERMAASLQMPAVLDSLPQRIRSLTIVPDDSLHGFPFAATVHRGKFLIEQYAVAIAFESHFWRPPRRQRGRAEALLVGVSAGGASVPPLPGVRVELDQLARWLERRQVHVRRLDEAAATPATRAALLEHLPRSRFWHIACHGFFEPERPDQSGLLFLPAPGQSETLSLRDLSELDLRGILHATLSACWSADNFILPGRWIISLPETLSRAGVHSILGSLWPLQDRFAAAFMGHFYGLLDSLPRDEALRRTQVACLRGALPGCGDLETRNPRHWSAFNLYGEAGALRM